MSADCGGRKGSACKVDRVNTGDYVVMNQLKGNRRSRARIQQLRAIWHIVQGGRKEKDGCRQRNEFRISENATQDEAASTYVSEAWKLAATGLPA